MCKSKKLLIVNLISLFCLLFESCGYAWEYYLNVELTNKSSVPLRIIKGECLGGKTWINTNTNEIRVGESINFDAFGAKKVIPYCLLFLKNPNESNDVVVIHPYIYKDKYKTFCIADQEFKADGDLNIDIISMSGCEVGKIKDYWLLINYGILSEYEMNFYVSYVVSDK